MDVIFKRRSVRSFKDLPIEDEKIEKLLRAGMQAPSANNQRPWYFLVIKDQNKLQELQKVSLVLPKAKCAILLLNKKDNLVTYGMVASDMGAATQNILLEAAYLGLGGCWIGLYSADGKTKAKVDNCRSICQVPEEYELYSMVALGYPSDDNANQFVDRFDESRVFYEKI